MCNAIELESWQDNATALLSMLAGERAEKEALRNRLDSMTAHRDYWRDAASRLIDIEREE